MILSDNEIKELVKDKLIEPFNESNLQAVSYDVTSSDIIRTFRGRVQAIDLSSDIDTNDLSQEQNIANGYDLLPGEYILVRLKERICLPADVTAHIRPRTTYTKLGLVLSDQHVNPTFEGHLFIGLRNSTPTVIKIFSGLIIGQLVFEKVSGDITPSLLYKYKQNAKYQNEDSFIAPKVKEELPPRLREIYDDIARDLAGGK